ncbi:MAG: cytochrome c-type biogenesis protein CcmH [Gammaproteobacteria bacterium]|nr:cytochrome c-type biogenesis protein CcmH [Gammaproteobacteria bacterium]MCZ6881326.1 cytochrome c-type biogenesis protein CcmH [Gammaproteobacteria bacterium]
MKKMIAVLLLMPLLSFAVDDSEPMEDPEFQARYETLVRELRCLVCQNQPIADSNAPLAKDLRRQVREMLLSGSSDSEIYSFMTDRYGDFVLYRPPFVQRTWLLWLAPGIFLLLGGTILARTLRQRAAMPIDDDDEDEGVIE